MKRIWIKNARLIDGTGAPARIADVIVEGDRILSVGEPGTPSDTVIDAAGKVVCPGFVDIHRHCDAKFLQDSDFGKVMLAQGITTTVVGNCGMSLTPSPADPAEMYDFMEAVLGSGCEKLGLHDYKDYVSALRSRPLPVNAASMVGNGSVKITVKGFADTPYTEAELQKAAALIENALNAGAVGVSCGIMYLPECYSTTAEFAEILKPLGKAGRVPHRPHPWRRRQSGLQREGDHRNRQKSRLSRGDQPLQMLRHGKLAEGHPPSHRPH